MSLRKFIVKALTAAGYRVSEANDGREAIDALELSRFDVVLTDVVMPNRNGFEVLAASRDRWPATSVIVMAGEGRASPLVYLESAARLGATATLTKPFTAEALLEAVDKAVELRAVHG